MGGETSAGATRMCVCVCFLCEYQSICFFVPFSFFVVFCLTGAGADARRGWRGREGSRRAQRYVQVSTPRARGAVGGTRPHEYGYPLSSAVGIVPLQYLNGRNGANLSVFFSFFSRFQRLRFDGAWLPVDVL